MEDTLYLSWRAPAGACISQINLKILNRLYYLRRGAQGLKIWQFEALKGGNHLKSLRNRQQKPSRDRAWQFSELILQSLPPHSQVPRGRRPLRPPLASSLPSWTFSASSAGSDAGSPFSSGNPSSHLAPDLK